MSNLTTNPVTLDDLRRAADEVRSKPDFRAYEIEWRRYERSRAEFWRLAYLWLLQTLDRVEKAESLDVAFSEQKAAETLIAEVEART